MKDPLVVYKIKDLDTGKYRENGFISFQTYGSTYSSLATINQMLAVNYNNWINYDWEFRNFNGATKKRMIKLFKEMSTQEKLAILYSPQRVAIVKLIEQEI